MLKNIYINWDGDKYSQLLQKLNQPAGKRLKTFSRGMKIKTSTAAALSHNSKLLILDEATSGLDSSDFSNPSTN